MVNLNGQDWYWVLSGITDLESILRALEAIVREGMVAYLEGSQDKSVSKQLASISEKLPSPVIASGSIFPKNTLFRIPLTKEKLGRLIALAETHASPQICLHLVIHDHQIIWIEAYDVG